MSNIAHFDKVAKFFRLVKKAVANLTGPFHSFVERPNLVAYLEMGCPKTNGDGEIVTPQLPEGEDLARFILGDDYLSAEDVAKAYCWNYTDDQLAKFKETLPELDKLMLLKKNGGLLQATPPTDCNLLQVRDLDRLVFYDKTKGWFTQPRHTFSRKDVVKSCQWLMVRKEPYPDSKSKNLYGHQNLLTEVEHVPNATEMAYAVTAYFKVRGIYLLKDECVRTLSVDADGDSVTVGNFGPHGLNVANDYDEFGLNDFAVGSSWETPNSLNT